MTSGKAPPHSRKRTTTTSSGVRADRGTDDDRRPTTATQSASQATVHTRVAEMQSPATSRPVTAA